MTSVFECGVGANLQCDSENELVWTCCNPLVAALLAAAHRQQGTDDEHILAVWDTQYHSSCDGKQPDQSVCASACYPSEHIIVGYNEAVFQKLDNKHTGKMGHYLKTALESNPQLDEAYGLLMCKTAIQVHCITRDSSNAIGSEWSLVHASRQRIEKSCCGASRWKRWSSDSC